MAVASSSASKKRVSVQNEEGKSGKKKTKSHVEENGHQAKRTNCPGLRVIGGRIYDSEKGKTCHQCRQKTMDFVASCKNMKMNKPCTINFCHKCLLNRYGEKAEEVESLEDWKCPKCRGICNCSFCMKKRGHKPTGILAHVAKENGFSSVSEFLNVKGPDNLSPEMSVKDGLSPKKAVVSKKDPVVVSPKKQGKENSCAGKSNSNVNFPNATLKSDDNKSKKKKREGLSEMCNGNRDDVLSEKSNPKKPRVSKEVSMKELKKNGEDHGKSKDAGVLEGVKKDKDKVEAIVKKRTLKLENKELDVDILLPPGTDFTTVADIELPPHDVGRALQFLEFCEAFGKALHLKKGQANFVLQELICERSGRRARYSAAVQFHIQLLSLILKDMGEKPPSLTPTNNKNSWTQALGKWVSESQYLLKELPSGCFDKGGDGYEKLDSSNKLRLLNFLCDEALCTTDLRKWIDDQNSKFVEKGKEAKEKVLIAKDKEKRLKQKLQDDVAKAIIAKSGAPISVSEHEAIVSQIKSEAAQAHAEMLEAMNMAPKKRQRSDAVRTEPILLDDNGRVFWRLKGHNGEPDILLQDMGTWDATAPNEKWIAYDAEQKHAIEKYIYSLRAKRVRIQKCNQNHPIGSGDTVTA